MKAVGFAALWIFTLAAAVALTRLTGPDRGASELLTVDAFRAALHEQDPLTRPYRLSVFLQNLGPDDLPAALEALEAHEASVTPDEVGLFMLAWSRFDAAAAVAWAENWPTPWRDTLMREAMYAWGFRDGRAALRALEDMEDSELRERLRPSLLDGWYRSDDKAGVGEYIAAVDDPRRRRRLTFRLAADTMRGGAEAVMRWVEAVPDDAPNNYKMGAFYHGAGVIARADPRRAAEWFEAHQSRPYSEGSLKVIARKWAQHHDLPALFDWLRSLSAEGEREAEPGEAIGAGFRVWLDKAPEEAEAWLRAAPPDPKLDRAVAEFAHSPAQSSTASGVEWAGRIQDEALRRRSTIRAGRMWWSKDPEAARAWLAESDLPEEVQRNIGSDRKPMAGRPAATVPAASEAR